MGLERICCKLERDRTREDEKHTHTHTHKIMKDLKLSKQKTKKKKSTHSTPNCDQKREIQYKFYIDNSCQIT